jgi:hypothetical protein
VWFGDTTTGTFCGADFSSLPQDSKGGCTSTQRFSGTLTSPPINLGGAPTATLHFFSWWEIESVDADAFDVMTVQWSADGGQTWHDPVTLNPASNPAGAHDQSYSNNGLEVSPSWHEYLVDLSNAAQAALPTNGGDGIIQIQFVFDTRDSLYNGFRGWLIDDISVDTPYDVPAPAISSVTTCAGTQDAPVTVVNGSNFVLGSQVQVDGSPVPTQVTSSQRIEIPALAAGNHNLQVIAPNGDASNIAQAAAGNCAPAPPSPPPPSPPPPSPSTSAPSAVVTGAPSVTSTGAGFTGAVNPSGLGTTAFFEYALDPKYTGGGPLVYTQSTPAESVGSDFTSHAVSASVSGLVPNALYHVRLVASNSAGTTFGPDVAFTTARAPAPGAPTLGRSFNITPVSGIVLLLLHGQLVPVTQVTQIPQGTVIDALHGTIQVITAAGGGHPAHDAAAKKGNGKKGAGKTQSGTFGGGVFKIKQAHNGLATLSLVEGAFAGAPSFATCKAHKAGEASAAALSSKTLQLLHASAKGKFATKGRFAAATVRGTKWGIADRCDGTRIRDITDSVAVTDFVRHKTIILHAGQSYLAKARK